MLRIVALAAVLAVAATTAQARELARAPVFTPPSDIIDEGLAHGAPVRLASLPGAFYSQQQPGYPQSPPGGGY